MARVWVSSLTWTPSLASTAWCRPSDHCRPCISRPGELIDDDHLAVHDDVVLLLLVDHVGPQALLQQVRPLHVRAGEERADAGDLLGRRLALVRQADLLVVVLHLVVLRRSARAWPGRRPISAWSCSMAFWAFSIRPVSLSFLASASSPWALAILRWAASICFLMRSYPPAGDQHCRATWSAFLYRVTSSNAGPEMIKRRPRLVDQNRVHLVDDRVFQRALHHLLQRGLHVVAQVVEAELVVGAVGDVALVLALALRPRGSPCPPGSRRPSAPGPCRSAPSTRRRAWPGSR